MLSLQLGSLFYHYVFKSLNTVGDFEKNGNKEKREAGDISFKLF